MSTNSTINLIYTNNPLFTAKDKNNKLMSSAGMEATEEEMEEFLSDNESEEAIVDGNLA